MLHRSTLYMAGAAMRRAARLSLLRASLAPDPILMVNLRVETHRDLYRDPGCEDSNGATPSSQRRRLRSWVCRQPVRLLSRPAYVPHGWGPRSAFTLRDNALLGLLGYTGRPRHCPGIGCTEPVLNLGIRTAAAPTKARHLTMASHPFDDSGQSIRKAGGNASPPETHRAANAFRCSRPKLLVGAPYGAKQ